MHFSVVGLEVLVECWLEFLHPVQDHGSGGVQGKLLKLIKSTDSRFKFLHINLLPHIHNQLLGSLDHLLSLCLGRVLPSFRLLAFIIFIFILIAIVIAIVIVIVLGLGLVLIV